MFDNMEAMMDRIKKKVYAERMERFREKNLEILAQMTDFVEQAEEQERDKAAAQVAKALADAGNLLPISFYSQHPGNFAYYIYYNIGR